MSNALDSDNRMVNYAREKVPLTRVARPEEVAAVFASDTWRCCLYFRSGLVLLAKTAATSSGHATRVSGTFRGHS